VGHVERSGPPLFLVLHDRSRTPDWRACSDALVRCRPLHMRQPAAHLLLGALRPLVLTHSYSSRLAFDPPPVALARTPAVAARALNAFLLAPSILLAPPHIPSSQDQANPHPDVILFF
jgi:hypothetical protein